MIPKRIFQIYKHNKLPLLYSICKDIILDKCSDYDYTLYTTKSSYFFIINNFPQYLELYESLFEKNKCLFFALLNLYKNGGIFMYLDVILNKSFEEILDFDKVLLPYQNDNKVNTFCMCSPKNNKFIYYLILKISNEFNTNANFITPKDIYYLYTFYNSSALLILNKFNYCFGSIAHYINYDKNTYPPKFMDHAYSLKEKEDIKKILIDDLQWFNKSDSYFI